MCAIIDNDVSHQVFGTNPTGPGLFFRNWLGRSNGGIIVAGGRLFRELIQNPNFRSFFEARQQAGRAIRIPDSVVDAAEAELQSLETRSNDKHVLALARVSGARLLFTNDNRLKMDFADPDIMQGMPGHIYTTNRGRRVRRYSTQEITQVTRTHRDLLRRNDLCAA